MRNDTFCACSFSLQKVKHIIHKFQGPNTTIYDSMNKENRYSHLFFSTTTKFISRRSKDREQICWHFAINNQWEYRFYLLNITFSNHLMFWNFQWLIVFVKVFFVLMHEIYVCIVLLYIHVVSFMLRATMNLRFFQIITRWWVVNASYGAWR